jgi:hypothetical protein
MHFKIGGMDRPNRKPASEKQGLSSGRTVEMKSATEAAGRVDHPMKAILIQGRGRMTVLSDMAVEAPK